MKKAKRIVIPILILSLVLNAFFIPNYFAYLERCKADSYGMVRVADQFDDVYQQVRTIRNDRKIDEGSLRTLQQVVAVAYFRLSGFPHKHNMGPENENDHYLTDQFFNLMDIVFKIHDRDHIPDDICDAIDRYDLVAYLEKLSAVSRAYIDEHYEGEAAEGKVKPFDGEELYKELRKVVS